MLRHSNSVLRSWYILVQISVSAYFLLNFARVVFLQTLNETVQLGVYYLIVCLQSYLCCIGKARNMGDIDIFVYSHIRTQTHKSEYQ
jgi:hypothetical protein